MQQRANDKVRTQEPIIHDRAPFPRSLPSTHMQVRHTSIHPSPLLTLTTPQALESFKTKLDNARRRAEAAEARTPELERLNAEQAEKLEQLQENLRSTRQATITLNHLLPVLQKLRDAQTKYAANYRGHLI